MGGMFRQSMLVMEAVLPDDPGFELLAASLRADSGDVKGFTGVLAEKLQAALPAQTRVERKGGLLSREKRVSHIVVDLGDQQYQLQHSGGRLIPAVSKVVRGIVLKTEEVSLDEWIDGLSRRLADEASRSEQARLALERLLGV